MRAYLAERWSRSQPKEAALDYLSDGMWRDAREAARAGIGNGATRTAGTRHDGPDNGQGVEPEAREAANDNAIVRIAQEIRHAVNGWRHGAAVDAFAAERAEVLAAWDELRERTCDAVALSPTFRETLDRHSALMKRAAMFRARPQVFERLLAERAGIGQREIEEFGEVHARAGSYRRSVAGKAARTPQTDTEQSQELAQADAPVETPARRSASPKPGSRARGSRARSGRPPPNPMCLPRRSIRKRHTGNSASTGSVMPPGRNGPACLRSTSTGRPRSSGASANPGAQHPSQWTAPSAS